MFREYPKNWWKYIRCIKDECASITELTQCSNKCVEKKLKMKLAEFQQKVNNTFNYDGDNAILKS